MQKTTHQRPHNSRFIIQSFAAKANARRSTAEKVADRLTALFGSMWFLLLNAGWFAIWIAVNTNLIPGVPAFDPFPFGLLTMVVSLEAIILAIVVLISQNREAKIADVREEVGLQMSVITEQEITQMMRMLATLMEKNGLDVSHDRVLKSMLQPTNVQKIERDLEEQIDSQS